MAVPAIGAAEPGDIAAVSELFRRYAGSLPFDLGFQNFAAELAGLPCPYQPPRGALLLARQDAAAVGVVGVKPLASDIAEIKRLYVVPELRGAGLGRELLCRAIAVAGRLGYAHIRLDSHRPSMGAAIALYRTLGFAEIPPYGPDPIGGIAFFEKDLRAGATQ